MSKAIHKGVACNECSTLTMVGIRFKCGSCVDYNLCAMCYPFSTHEHAFVALKKPLTSKKEKTVLFSSGDLYETKGSFSFETQPWDASSFRSPFSFAPSTEHKKGPLFDKIVTDTYPVFGTPSTSLFGDKRSTDEGQSAGHATFSF